MMMLWELLKVTEGFVIVECKETEEDYICGDAEDLELPNGWIDKEVTSIKTEEGVLTITLEEGDE